MDLGLLIVRVLVGLLIAAHGAQKLFGWFGGYGLTGTGGFFESLGFRPGRFFAAAAGLGELGSGVLMALGLLGPFGPAVLLSIMIVAAVSVHGRNGLFATSNGIELPLVYGIVAVALALTGFGELSLDRVLGLSGLWTPAVNVGALVLGVVAGIGNLAIRRPAAVTA